MSSFSDYYKKWKDNNGITEETAYRNLSNEEKAQSAMQNVDRTFEKIRARDIQKKQEEKELKETKQKQRKANFENFLKAKTTAMNEVSNKLQEQKKKNVSEEILFPTSNNQKNVGLLFDNSSTNIKDVILNSGNKKETIEQQIEQEIEQENKANDNILEAVYKQKNNIQEDKKTIGNFTKNKINIYEKNLAINKQNSENKKNDNILQDVEAISGMGGLGTQSSNLQKLSNYVKGVQDVAGLGKIVGLGASSGGKEVLNHIESTNEKFFSNYKNLRKDQFLTSPNVRIEDKTRDKMGENIETNLVKKAIRDSIAKDEQNIQETQRELNYKVAQKLGDIAPSMGQMLPGMALNAVNPVLGTSYFMTSAGGGYINDALNRGMTEEQAWKYGTVMGILEGASESFITGQQVNKITNAFGGKQISKKVLESYGFNIFENAVQEAVMEPAQEITAGIVGDKADLSNMGQRMMESGFNGALMGVITNGVTYGLEKSGIVYNKIKNNEQITIEEYKEALQENINKFGKEVVENSIRQGALETYQEINNVVNLQQNTIENQNNQQIQQVTNQEDKIAQNGNIEQIDRTQTIKGYHGTDANFENYSLEHFGKHDEGDFGKAVYFSTEKSTATKYGKNVKENNIKLKNPFIINNEQDYKKMWNELGKKADKEKLSIEEKNLLEDKYTSQTDKDYILYNTLTAEEKSNILQEMGYDGVIDNTYNQIAVFNPNIIENNSKTMYNNIVTESEGGKNEGNVWEGFRGLQEEARIQLNRDSGERINVQDNEKLRRRLTNNLRGELEHRGYNASFDRRILLKSNKGIEFNMFDGIDANTFHDIFEISKAYTKNGELVDLHIVEDYKNTKNYLSDDGMSGFAITKDGDLISVFNAHGDNKKGFLSAISDIVKDKVKSLDCYVSEKQNLREIYEKKFGFKTASIMEYNMEYDHDNIAKNHNSPQVAFMVNTQSEVPTKYFNKDQYKEAIEYRNKFIDNGKGLEQSSSFNLQDNVEIEPIREDINMIKINTNNHMQNNENNSTTRNLANNQQTVYNNTESEGGIDGTIQGFQRLSGQFDPSIFKEESKQAARKYNKQEYSKWEQSIRPKEESNLTIEEKTIKDNIKSQYGKDIVFFDGENNQKYISGASLNDRRKIYIDKQTASDFGIDKVINHEIMESDIRHNRKLSNEIIKPSIDKIIEDKNFKKQKEIFWANEDGEMPSNFAVAKELLCDRFAEIKTGESLDYKNILSQETNMTIDYALESFHQELYGKGISKNNTDLAPVREDINTAKVKGGNIAPVEKDVQKKNSVSNLLNEVETNTQSLEYKADTEGKQRKHYKSVMESDQVGEVGKQSAKSLLENDTYMPISNIDTISTANENINRNGVDNTYIAFRNKINSNERITLQDIAIGERLIQIFSQNGDFEKVNGLIQDVSILGTELGQQVQAMSLIKKMSPEGQLMYLNKVVERTNIKENVNLEVTDEMTNKILSAKNQTELDNAITDIAVELGEQLPITTKDKIRSWRYLSMLGNPKTHIKNLGANVFMNITQQVKNKVGGIIEDTTWVFNKNLERTKTLKFANKDQRSFAKQDAEFMKDKIDGGGKYDIKNAIQSNKRQFKNKVLNAIADFNSNMLELEDNIFLKKAYQQAMQNYMSANKLNSTDMQNSSTLQKAREYASLQAQEATFHQFSSLAQRLTEVENKGGISGKALEAILPFKKTPMNIAKEGIEYSPIGLAKTLTYDIVQLNRKTKDYKVKLEKGSISQEEYKTGVSKLVTKTIDNTAKGLTGTSLAILGYALADMGILKSGNDGDDDEFKEELGEQEYAIRIGDNTYTLDWISPSAIPMFIGSTIYDLTHSEKEDNSDILNSLMTASAKAFEPMTDMSMLQGITSAISSYEQGSSNMLFDVGASAVSSYMGQFVPTALGQVAKIIDDKDRDTSSTEKGLAKKVDQFTKQQIAKIPIASKLLPARKDVWGNDKTRDSNVLVRAYEVALAPYNKKKIVEDYTNKELLTVFENTGEMVLPGIPNKDITINKQKYRLTSEEYNKAKESFGKTSKSMLDSLVKTKEYKNLTDGQKAEAINNVYSYAKEKIKVDYAKNKKQEIDTTSSYNILKELKDPTNQSEYLVYSSKIKGIEKDKEKKQILANGNYSSTTKNAIYKNTLGKEDELYNNVLGKDNININEYLKYKLQEFESDKEDDGTEKGKAVSGSKKEKVYNYVNNMNITREQKIAILGTQYKLNYKEEKMDLYNYINKISVNTKGERLEIFRKYNKNFVIYKDGTMNLK